MRNIKFRCKNRQKLFLKLVNQLKFEKNHTWIKLIIHWIAQKNMTQEIRQNRDICFAVPSHNIRTVDR